MMSMGSQKSRLFFSKLKFQIKSHYLKIVFRQDKQHDDVTLNGCRLHQSDALQHDAVADINVDIDVDVVVVVVVDNVE